MKNNDNIPADWQPLLELLDKKKQQASEMGGQGKLQKIAAQSRLNARQIIELFIDDDTFQEVGQLANTIDYQAEPLPTDGIVGGIGNIQQIKCVIAVEDFSIKGGSIGHLSNAKRVRLANIALEQTLPYILILDGAGARAATSHERFPYTPNDLQILAKLKGKVPIITIVTGSSAGHGAISGIISDCLIMLEKASLFAAGPPIVAASTGEIVSKEDLGGSLIHSQNGICHLVAKDEAEAKTRLLQLLDFIHLPNKQGNLSGASTPILEVLPANLQNPYDMRQIIDCLVDVNTWLELSPGFGKSIITGIARINGQTILVVANQPNVLAGAINKDAAEKASEFIETYSRYNFPFLFLADTPGVLSGSTAEKDGTLKSAAKMYLAQSRISSKKIHITLRKAFGFGSSLMAMNPFDKQLISFGFPCLSLGSMPASGAAEASNASSKDAESMLEAESSGAWIAADAMAYDEIIDPRETREKLMKLLDGDY